MTRVLAAPVEFNVTDRDYGKSYNLLTNLRDEDLSVDAYVSSTDAPIASDSVTVHELKCSNRLSYYWRVFRVACKALKAGNVDVYHHVNLSYRWFNPLLLAGVHGDTPVVLGPCQGGHQILAEEFNQMISHAVGQSVSRMMTDPVFSVIQATRGVTIDPVRESLFHRTVRAADKIVVVHEEARDAYADIVDESKLKVVPLGVNPNQFEFTTREDNAMLVAIGSLRRRKGYDVLLKALSTVTTERPGAHLHVFGTGPQADDLQTLAEDLGVSSSVTFHGFVPQSELKEYLSQARVFVHPSRSESFSLVRLEAMAAGCPVVVTNTDGAREMVRNGKEGFVVETEASEKLADRILEVLSDYELTRALGRAARDRVEEKYDWEEIGRQYVKVYESVAST